MAIEAISRIDALFVIEREINGLPPAERQAARDTRSYGSLFERRCIGRVRAMLKLIKNAATSL